MANVIDSTTGGGNAPLSFPVTAVQPYSLTAVNATFDGTGAASDFKASLAVYSQDGKLVGRFFPDDDVATGDTALVTFAPFSRASRRASGFIRYGVENVGDFLHVEATDVDEITLHSAGDIALRADSNSLNLTASDFVRIFMDGTFFVVENATNAQRLVVEANGNTTVQLSTLGRVEVLNAASSPIFRVDENGDLHGKTGKALTFDL